MSKTSLFAALMSAALFAAPAALAQAKKPPAPAADAKKAPAAKTDEKKAAKPAEKAAKTDEKAAKTDEKAAKTDEKAAKKEEKAAKKPAGKTEITWLGHAAFQIVSPEGTVLLVDPFLTGNPSTPADKKDLAKYKPDAILVSHSHADHFGDTPALAKQSKAPVIGEFGFISSLKIADEQKMGGNVGGTVTVKDVTIHMVPAMHGSAEGGRPLGFVIEFKKKGAPVIYHSGDTWIFSDMKLIQDIYKPTVLLVASGGGPFTQDPTTAAMAVKKFFKPKTVVPIHYGTYPILSQEADVKKAFKALGPKLKVLKPGETLSM